MSQVTETIDSVPAMPYALRSLGADTSTVHPLYMRIVYTHDPEGNRKRVQSFSTDLSDVTTDVHSTFDRANRLIAQDDGKLRSFTLDPAGNPIQSVTATGRTINSSARTIATHGSEGATSRTAS